MRGAAVQERKEERAIPQILSASTIKSDTVRNPQGEELGKIEEVMIDLDYGRVAYVCLSFGGILGLGEKLFAVPWGVMRLAPHEHRFVLDVPREHLEKSPGFEKSGWPLDREWLTGVYRHYGIEPYWVSPC